MSIRKIASISGFSTATVSLALRNNPKIPEETRRKIRRIAQRCGYSPDPRVRDLMGVVRQSADPGNRGCIGVISFYDSPRPWERSRHLSRLYEGMTIRSEELGYRLEPMWLRAPDMTSRRFRNILDTRGIEGLVCFGSPNIGEGFPPEFDHYSIVTQGVSIRTACHRVINNAFSDTQRVLNRLQKLGYRRPGLILSNYEHHRGAHANLSAYLGWCENYIGDPRLVPVLRIDTVEPEFVLAWIKSHKPDVILVVHDANALSAFNSLLRDNGISVPDDLGVAALSPILHGTPFSGIEEDQHLMGAWVVELVVSRIMNRDFGVPKNPRTEMVEGLWIEGKSLRAADSDDNG